jgi:CubicO group peptidase (beta-lactamase class C family)
MRFRRLLPLLILIACGEPRAPTDTAQAWTAADSARAASVLPPLVERHQFMGAIALVRDGAVVYSEGAGMADVAAGQSFTPHTPADGASLAKTFTAATLWSLVHEGKIAVDTPVTAYLPDYPHAGTTVRQLIAHTNGLPPYYEVFDPYFQEGEVRTTEALLSVVGRHMPAPGFPPGTRFEYSNLGFDAAALVIERITGQPIATVLRDRFFTPLGLDSAFARPARLADWRGPRTLGHRWADSAWVVVDVFDNEAFIGASNLYFSALDLARWAGANADGRALPPAVARLGAERPRIDGRPSPINGLSWYCDATETRCYYTGAINAFNSLAYWDRSRREGIAMISNSDLAPWTMVTLHRALIDALAGRMVKRAPDPTFVVVAKQELRALAGRYVAAGLDTLHVTVAGDGLRLRVGSGLEFDVFHVRPDAFYVPGPDWVFGVSGVGAARRLHVRSIFVDAEAIPID